MQLIQKYSSVFVVAILCSLILIPSFVLAQTGGTGDATGGTGNGIITTLDNPLCKSGDPNCVSTFTELLNKIIGFLIEIGGILLVIIVLIGAYQMLFAAGNPTKFATGKKTIIYATIGYAIILLARGIELIIKDVLK